MNHKIFNTFEEFFEYFELPKSCSIRLTSEECAYFEFYPYKNDIVVIPCWSLATLIDIIPYAINISDNKFYRLGIDKGYNSYAIWYEDNGCTVNTLDVKANNFIDACYEMIIRLRKLNLL